MMELREYVRAHGARVSRGLAMTLLCITDSHTFRKVVDANPALAHRLPGEGRSKYSTAEIHRLLAARARCAPVVAAGGIEKRGQPSPQPSSLKKAMAGKQPNRSTL